MYLFKQAYSLSDFRHTPLYQISKIYIHKKAGLQYCCSAS